MFWFSIGGHRLAVEGLLQSFQRFPVGQMHFSQSLFGLGQSAINDLSSIHDSVFVANSRGWSQLGFFVAGFSSKILGAGQTVAFSFGFNQVLAYLILPAMMILFFNQMFDGTTSQIETVIEVLALATGEIIAVSDSDRIHEPSPIRLIQARDDGIVARSGELVRSLIVCVTIGSILMFVGTAQSIFETNIKRRRFLRFKFAPPRFIPVI